MSILDITLVLLGVGFFLAVLAVILRGIAGSPANTGATRPKRSVKWTKDHRGVEVKEAIDPDGTKHVFTFPGGRKHHVHSHKVIKDGRVVYHRDERGQVVINERRNKRSH